MDEVVSFEVTKERTNECEIKYANGDRYRGQHLNKIRHGQGELLRANGTFYIGRFDHGKFWDPDSNKYIKFYGGKRKSKKRKTKTKTKMRTRSKRS